MPRHLHLFIPPSSKKKKTRKPKLCSYQLIHAEPVLDAGIEPERMEMLKEVKIK